MFKAIRILLGKLDFDYCPKCGTKQIILYTHGFNDTRVCVCPICDTKRIKEYQEFKRSLSIKL